MTSNTLFNQVNSGEKEIIVSDKYGCNADTMKITITKGGLQHIDYAVAADICGKGNGSIEVLNDPNGTSNISYSLNGGLLQSNSIFNNLLAGSYDLYVTDGLNCSSTITVSIPISQEVKQDEIPNVFSPNGDQINDLWTYDFSCYINVTCTILNRWGQVLYASDTNKPVWNGQNKEGVEVPDATYFYLIQLVNNQGERLDFTGPIALVR